MRCQTPHHTAFYDPRKGRSVAPRPERFGRYDPVTHQLTVDAREHSGAMMPPGSPPITLHVGERGRLQAVLDAGLVGGGAQLGLSRTALADHVRDGKHEGEGMWSHGKQHIPRNEEFGRYDPLTSTLTFTHAGTDAEETVRVGDQGRLRSVLESGKLSRGDASVRSSAVATPPAAPSIATVPVAHPRACARRVRHRRSDSRGRRSRRRAGGNIRGRRAGSIRSRATRSTARARGRSRRRLLPPRAARRPQSLLAAGAPATA